MKKQLAVLGLLVIMPLASLAADDIRGDSNISSGGYPTYTSKGPSKPRVPYDVSDYSYQRYEKEVNEYNKKLNNYIINAEYDALLIKIQTYLAKQEINKLQLEFNEYQAKYKKQQASR